MRAKRKPSTTITNSATQDRSNRGAGLTSVAECGPMSALTSETHGIASFRLRAAPQPSRRLWLPQRGLHRRLDLLQRERLGEHAGDIGLELAGAAELACKARHENDAQLG